MNIDRENDTLKINNSGDITATNVEDIRKSILEELDESLKFVEVNLNEVELIDSTGISLLISIQNSLTKNEGRLKIKNANENISYMFNMMRLNHHFEIN